MKKLGLIISSLCCVVAAFSQTYTLDWGSSFTPAWTTGSTTGTANNIGGSGRNLTVSSAFTGSGSVNAGYPFINNNYTSTGTFAYQVQGSTDAIVYGQNLGNRTSYITITYTFSQPVQNVLFGVCDIDRPASGSSPFSYLDQITASGTGPAGAITPALSLYNPSSTILAIASNVATANGGVGGGAAASLAQGSPDQNATIFVNFNGNAVTTITLRYGLPNLATVQTDPGDQFVGIGNFTFQRAIAPVTTNVNNASILSHNAGQTDIDNLAGTDDESISSYTITSLPSAGSGVLYYFNGTSYVPVTAGLVITPAQANTLRFDPTTSFNGSATFNYTALDNRGLTSNSSVFTIVVSTTLPLTLLDFTATLQDNKTILAWITSDELNTKEFTVERSADLANWETVATIPAAGNSNGMKNYSAIDNNPLPVTYYRLKMTDIDGKYKWSSVLQVRVSSSKKINVYPNPFGPSLTLEVQTATQDVLNIRLINSAGATVYNARKNAGRGLNIFLITGLNLANGQYLLEIKNSNNETISVQKLTH